MKTLRLKRVKDTSSKLIRTAATDDRDCSWWRIRSSMELCSEEHEENERKVKRSQTVDRLFSTEEARLTFRKFWNFEVSSVDETRILTLVQLEVIITDAFDSLAESISNMKQILYSINENPELSRHTLENENIVRDSGIRTKGGCIQQVSAEKLKARLAPASSQLFRRYH